MDKPGALLVCPEAPYPAAGGGALRTASLAQYLAGRYALDVIVFAEPGAGDPAAAFPAGLARSVHTIPLEPHARGPVARAWRNAHRLARGVPPLNDRFSGYGAQVAAIVAGRHYRVAVTEHFWCAPYWEQVASHAERTVLDLHNVESALLLSQAHAESGPVAFAFGRFGRECLELERRWLPKFSLLLASSKDDAARLEAIAPGARALVYPNAVPLVELPRPPQDQAIVFSGNLEYQPNISAVRFFRMQIWPRLRERWPRLVWRLIGKNPAAVERWTSGDARIERTGPVENAVEELARAQVAVVPVTAGSGTRVKVIEAWAAGLPVVATTLGAEGLGARDGKHLVVADAPEDFAAAVSALLASEELRVRIGQAGRALYEREFNWPAAWKRLAEAGLL